MFCTYEYVALILRTRTHTRAHTYVHTYIHTYMHTYIHIHTCIHTYVHTYIHTYIYIQSATVGVDFSLLRITVFESPFKVTLYDTAGQERFKSLTTSYFRQTDVAVAAFDMTSAKSLENTKTWLDDAHAENKSSGLCTFLVGTKLDLVQDDEQAYAVRCVCVCV